MTLTFPLVRPGLLLFAALVMAAALVLGPPSAQANHRYGLGSIRHSDDYQRRRHEIDIRYEDRDAVRLQREAIAAQEEARREQQRIKRRDEIENEARKSQEDYLKSQEEIRAASLAARRSPRGVYYRRPGTNLQALPAGHVTLQVDGREYFYFSGIFFRRGAGDFYVVTAPPGTVVTSLPEGHLPLRHGGRTLYYYFGSFFEGSPGSFAVVRPPEHVIVPYLPDGYVSEKAGDGLHFVFGGVRYRPVYREGLLVYAVSGG